jgi:hypothetical protein
MSTLLLAFLPKPLSYAASWAMRMWGTHPLDNRDPKNPQALTQECSEAECLNLNIETPFLE